MRRHKILAPVFSVISILLSCAASSMASAPAPEPVATFSCVGFDPATGDVGIAVQSKFFAVGSVVPWARADAGAIATQAFANTAYAPRGLDLLHHGVPPEEVVRALTEADTLRSRRQMGIVDARGRSATYTGTECLPYAGGRTGPHYAVQGNILSGAAVIDSMASAFERTAGWLGDRLLASLQAGQAAGGDSRGMQSAALLIVRQNGGYGGFNDRYCDLRVDDAVDPIREIQRLYALWKLEALILEGYRLLERGEFDLAYTLAEEATRLAPDQGEPLYHLACYRSRGGHPEMALAYLRSALERRPELAVQARQDPDLAPLRGREEFLRITGAASPSGSVRP